MKSRILWLFLMILGLRLSAQTGLHVGVFGMPQNTWIFNREDTEESRTNFSYKMTWGWAGMFKLGYNFGPPFGIHVGAIYSRQGQKHTSQDTSGNTILSQRDLTYIKIPLLIHINSDPGKAMLNIEFGPQIGLLQQVCLLEDDLPVNLPFSSLQLYKPTDISFAWCLGAEFMLTEFMSLVLVHRGDYGLFDIENKAFSFGGSNFYPNGRLRSKNGCYGIMAGLNFCISPGRGGGRRTDFWFR